MSKEMSKTTIAVMHVALNDCISLESRVRLRKEEKPSL